MAAELKWGGWEAMDFPTSYYNALARRAIHDEAAFSELYEHFFPRVYNFIFARLKNPDAADDIISTAFMKMYENLPRYDPERAAFSTWFFRIALNCMTDYFRRKESSKEAEWEEFFDPAAPEYQEPEAKTLAEESRVELLKALGRLTDKERRVVELKYFSGLGNKEIAEVMGITANNVGVVLHGALKKLRRQLDTA